MYEKRLASLREKVKIMGAATKKLHCTAFKS